jgi:hypothetical protein
MASVYQYSIVKTNKKRSEKQEMLYKYYQLQKLIKKPVNKFVLMGAFFPVGVVLCSSLIVLAQNSHQISQSVTTSLTGGLLSKQSLVGASSNEVAQIALKYTNAQYKSLSGSPTVILTRSITTKELPSLGLPEVHFSNQEPPLMMVIVKGDFDVSNIRGGGEIPKSNWHWRVGYIAYLMDLNAGFPSGVFTSPTGGRFRKVLNDPNLPDEQPANPQLLKETNNRPKLVPLPQTPIVPETDKQPYGTVTPGILYSD